MPTVPQLVQHLANEINFALDDLPGGDRRKAQARINPILEALVKAAEQPVAAEPPKA